MRNITPWIERVHALSTSYENQEAMQAEITDLRTALEERDAESLHRTQMKAIDDTAFVTVVGELATLRAVAQQALEELQFISDNTDCRPQTRLLGVITSITSALESKK